MPQLVKGAKWTWGWVIVGEDRRITIPCSAWDEYGFQPHGEAIFLRGSNRSGGFAISTPALLSRSTSGLAAVHSRVLARSCFLELRQIRLPEEVGGAPGDRLLTVRGSRYGLGFIARGPIYEEALRRPELGTF